jgi:hypothetical protein
VRLEADHGAIVVDGSADALAGLAAFGALPSGRFAYAGDASADEVRRASEVVVSDSNRRRVLAAARMAQNHGATLAADDPFSPDAAVLDLFPARGTDGQTVATYEGARYLRMPFSPAYSQFPERRPFAAFDGDPATHWQADRALEEARHWLEIGFDAPRDVESVELLPYSDRRAKVTAVEIAGRTFPVRRGWNRLELGLRDVRSLRVRIARVQAPGGVPDGPGGIRELRIPGMQVREALRPPVLAELALAGRDLAATGLTYLFERTTGDDPFRRDPRRGTSGAVLVRDRQDGERGLERQIAPPAARAWEADGWGTVDPRAPDSALDGLAGGSAAAKFDSSGRFQGRPGFRASSAFDGRSRPWIGSWLDGRTAWIEWTTPRRATVRALRLEPPEETVRRPTLVRLHVDGEASPALEAPEDGWVTLPEPMRGSRFRLEILRAAFPAGASGVERQRRAVGIREITGAGVPIMSVRRGGRVRGTCGDLDGTLGDARVRMRVDATVADLDAGRPLRFRSCGEPARAAAGAARFSLPAAIFAPYLVRLRSPAPDPPARTAAVPGRVLDTGTPKRDARTGVKLEVREPAWLVLGQSYSDAWRASCDGRDLGAPVPADGYAMAWRVPAGCRDAEMAFAPDSLVRAGYLVSLPLLLAMLGLVLVRRPPAPEPLADELPEPSAGRMPAERAAALALLAGAALGFVFAARAAPLIALATFLILWRGIGVRALVTAAGALLLVAVPVLTLAIGVEDRGGYNPEYAQVRIAVHWVAVAAVILLVLALARVLGAARRRRSPA